MSLDATHPILKLMALGSYYLTILGALLVAYSGSDDRIIEGLEQVDEDAALEEIIDTNQDNIETVLTNQKRMYALHRSHHQSLKSLFYRGIGLLATLMAALIGLVGTVLVL